MVTPKSKGFFLTDKKPKSDGYKKGTYVTLHPEDFINNDEQALQMNKVARCPDNRRTYFDNMEKTDFFLFETILVNKKRISNGKAFRLDDCTHGKVHFVYCMYYMLQL